MALPMIARAQDCDIQKVFDKIINTDGIVHSDSRTVERDEDAELPDGDLMEATVIHDIRVGRVNFGLFKELEKAFQNGNYPVMPSTIYTCFNPMENSSRQHYVIRLRNGSTIQIGQHENSSYALVVLPDGKKYRTVYAAEWWDTDDENIREGRLIRSYGEKPRTQGYSAISESLRHLPSNFDEWRERLNIPDSASISDMVQKARQWAKGFKLSIDTVAANIPLDNESIDSWMNKATNSIGHLSNTDWHRFFGLLTEKMVDPAHKYSSEEKVVAAGIILDLCKNAPLDDDEREVCAKRLQQVANAINTSNTYVRDMLLLAKKNLQRK